MPSLTPAKSPFWQGLPGGPGVRARLQSVLGLLIVLAIALITSPRASALLSVLLTRTGFGRYVRAVGDRRCQIGRPDRVSQRRLSAESDAGALFVA
jgi:hypothetical protein